MRLRPFSDREKELVKKGASKLCVAMPTGNKVVVNDANTGKPKEYEFDYAYWSHDKAGVDKGGHFADQAKVCHNHIPLLYTCTALHTSPNQHTR